MTVVHLQRLPVWVTMMMWGWVGEHDDDDDVGGWVV